MHRIQLVNHQFHSNNFLLIKDNRTEKQYQLPLQKSRQGYYFYAKDLEQIKNKDNQPLRIYDPAYMNTICATSQICYIDGQKGILEYRGYPIEQLVQKSTFLQVAYLLIHGDLPTKNQLQIWQNNIRKHTILHSDVIKMMKSFRFNAHPMGMMISTIAGFSTFKPQANPALAGQNIYKNIQLRNKQIYRLLGIIPTIAANSYRHRIGLSFNEPHQKMNYTQNFLFILDKYIFLTRINQKQFIPNQKLVKSLQVLFILHAEHQFNCSTSFIRHISSSGGDVYTTFACAMGTLYGIRHGGDNQAVVRMLQKIGKIQNIPQFLQDVKDKKKFCMDLVTEYTKTMTLEQKQQRKLHQRYLKQHKNNPYYQLRYNQKRWLCLISILFRESCIQILISTLELYTKLWVFHLICFQYFLPFLGQQDGQLIGKLLNKRVQYLKDKQNNIYRPRQNYQGYKRRNYIPIQKRVQIKFNLQSNKSKLYTRREVSSKL